MNLRKLSLTKETIFADAARLIGQPITRRGGRRWQSVR
jgi:hypothetical protein